MNKQEILKKFFEKYDVLIVDKNPSSRNRLLKMVCDLGPKRSMIHTCGSLKECEEIINTKDVGLVLCEYFIDDGTGFELFKILRDKNSNNKELTLVLVTSNISQTAVAKAAEEDVDSFIIKPYTIMSIQENLTSTIAAKVKPSEYILKIEEGKKLIGESKYQEAIDILKKGAKLDPRPALAMFYIGQAEYLQNSFEEATKFYYEGLKINNIHYKCLEGLYDVFMGEKRFPEAYQIVKKIATSFPIHPDRLSEIIRLCVLTKNFQDMQTYYEIFTSLDQRLPALTNYIGAGMYISGKYFLLQNDKETALKYFNNIAISGSEFTKFLKGIIAVLVENDMAQEAEKFLGRFDLESKELEDYLISDFLVSSKMFNSNGAIIKLGLDLYNKNIRDYSVMTILIHAMEEEGYSENKIAPYKEKLSSLSPDKGPL